MVQGRADAITRFPHFGVRQADYMESRKTGSEMDLHGNFRRIDS
jgi:hypothetical protein